MTPTEIATFLGVFVGGVVAGLVGFFSKKASPPATGHAPSMAAIGLEFGSRQQTDQMIAQLTRIADALDDKNSDAIQDKLDELLRAQGHPPR